MKKHPSTSDSRALFIKLDFSAAKQFPQNSHYYMAHQNTRELLMI